MKGRLESIISKVFFLITDFIIFFFCSKTNLFSFIFKGYQMC